MTPRYQIRWYAQLEHGLAGGTMHFECLADAVKFWDGMDVTECAEWHREMVHSCGRVVMNESNNGGY